MRLMRLMRTSALLHVFNIVKAALHDTKWSLDWSLIHTFTVKDQPAMSVLKSRIY